MSDRPLIVVRPEPGFATTLAAAREAGLAAYGQPLFRIEPVLWQAPPPSGYAGLLVGSANVFRHGGKQLAGLASLPVMAVGDTTAQAARDAGFVVTRTGNGGLDALAGTLPPGHYVRLAGERHVALVLPEGVTVDTLIVYAARPVAIAAPLAALLAAPCVVLLHSAEAARHVAHECDRIGIARANVQLACLAPRIAAAAGTGWHTVASAGRRDDAALLALARQMCQTP
ncbi:uroporphyrinogen-III synthase [Novosphingobium lentum]|uniref:uroporphyrinogen-III synthase n=1 Tax=Novosphingobium lentum TaxID=145287 RepID=UPI00083447BF|nr:uroporphyrinogen-III synthase [Novosphingobium lentum]